MYPDKMRHTARRLALSICLVAALLVPTASPAGAHEAEPNFKAPWECGKEMFPASRDNHAPAVDFHGYGPEWPNYGTGDPGMDELGAPVLAMAAGVATTSDGGAAGHTVTIDHGNGWTSNYLHLVAGTGVSGLVAQGETIGQIGDTGNANGAHLHAGVYHHGTLVEMKFDGTPVPYEEGISTRNNDPAISPRVVSTNCDVTPLGPAHMALLGNGFGPTVSRTVFFSDVGSTVVAGDWNGDGRTDLAKRRQNEFEMRGADGRWMNLVGYGKPGDEVFVGDWDCNGTDTLAVRRGNIFFLKNTIASGDADIVLGYGQSGDEVFVGDWNDNGCDTFAVRRSNVFYVRNTNTTGVADVVFGYGKAADEVFVGDYDGDGADSFMVRRGVDFYLRNDLRPGNAETVFAFGEASDAIVVGDWDANGSHTLGAVRIFEPAEG